MTGPVEYKKVNLDCLEMVRKYQSLKIGNSLVCTPYFMNNVELFFKSLMQRAGVDTKQIEEVKKTYREKEVPYGWYRGKGTPQEIEEATETISKEVGLDLKVAGTKTILDFMKLYALGVDCSGFVYNVLSYGLDKNGLRGRLDEILSWSNIDNIGVHQAATFVFSGKASNLIQPLDIKPLDLILIKSRRSGQYVHIGLILEEPLGRLSVFQSTITKSPAGVRGDRIEIKNNKLKFSFRPKIGGVNNSWEKLLKEGNLELRRLLL